MFESSKEKDPVFGGVLFYTLVNKLTAVEKILIFFIRRGCQGATGKPPDRASIYFLNPHITRYVLQYRV